MARGYLGVHLAQALEAADAISWGSTGPQGALVESVYADTPAAGAGLRANDVIL